MSNNENLVGQKFPVRMTAGTGAPTQIVGRTSRMGLVMFNEGPSPVRIGNPSGTLATLGMLLPSGTFLIDNLSDDEWWMQAVGASSGTISGYIVEA